MFLLNLDFYELYKFMIYMNMKFLILTSYLNKKWYFFLFSYAKSI